MNDQLIYLAMAKKPDLRAVDLADQLDKDLEDVNTALGPLLRVGDIVSRDGQSPNGYPAKMYNLSADFKKTAAYREVLEIMERQGAAAQPVQSAPEASTTAAPKPDLKIPRFVEGGPTRVEIMVEYITKLGKVSQEDLRAALGMGKGEYPIQYLSSSIKKGIVIKDGDNWKAGPNAASAIAPTPERRAESRGIEKRQPLLGITPDPNAVVALALSGVLPDAQAGAILRDAYGPPAAAPLPPEEVEAIGTVELADIAPALAPPVFRCGLWSDGVLELQRDGKQVVALERGEQEHLADFMRRMLGAAVEAV